MEVCEEEVLDRHGFRINAIDTNISNGRILSEKELAIQRYFLSTVFCLSIHS